MAPYFCMGFTLLSVMTEDGPITVNEADYIVIDDNGNLSIDSLTLQVRGRLL